MPPLSILTCDTWKIFRDKFMLLGVLFLGDRVRPGPLLTEGRLNLPAWIAEITLLEDAVKTANGSLFQIYN
jgi:hypothetical protein